MSDVEDLEDRRVCSACRAGSCASCSRPLRCACPLDHASTGKQEREPVPVASRSRPNHDRGIRPW